MKKILYISILVLLAAIMNGCYGNYKSPAPEKVWNDQDIVTEGYQIVTIEDLKQKYYSVYPAANNYAANKVIITEPLAIRGKVTSNDKPGNYYRNMVIQDATGAIEIKVGKGSLQNEYRVGQTIYVIAENLTLGNYRYMLSLGVESIDAKYANDYIDLQVDIDRHIKKGEHTKLTAADTLVVNNSNFSSLRDPQDLGRLVRFEGLKSTWGTYNGDPYPSFLQTTPSTNSKADPVYTDRTWADVITAWNNHYFHGGAEPAPIINTGVEGGKIIYPYLPDNRLYPTWGYHDTKYNNSFYGSAYFRFDAAPTTPPYGGIGIGNYVVRTSGYCKFANEPLPKSGATVTMTAFLNKYCASSGGYQVYQLVINNSSDVDLISGQWANQ